MTDSSAEGQPGIGWVMTVPCGERSRVDLLGDDGQHDVLVTAPHHHPQILVSLDGGADVIG